MLPNLGISTSYFAAREFSIYDSVDRAYKLGFRLIELGANHNFEDNIWQTLLRIKRDFSGAIFTQHCYFPPTQGNFFSNPAEGLTKENKQVLESMLKAAKILGSKVISFHSGLNAKFTYKGLFREWNGFKEFTPRERISQNEAKVRMKEFIKYILDKTQSQGIKIAIENIVGRPEYPATLTSFADFKNFLAEVPEVYFLFDYGHGFIVLGNPDLFFSLGEKIIEIHLDDVDTENYDHRILGTGVLNLARLFAEIKKLPIMPLLVLEHSAEIGEEEIGEEVKLVENYLR